MPDEFVCLNGEITRTVDATVSVLDAGFLHAAGLFETIHVRNRKPFRMNRHIVRLEHSAEVLQMLLPDDRNSWPQDIARLLDANRITNARVRITVTAGSLIAAQGSTGFSGSVVISASDAPGYPREMYERGVTVCISSYRVSPFDPIAGHKTLCYLPRLIALREARDKQCAESLWFTTNHHLAEGCHTNVAIVTDGVVRTPALDTPVLDGVTRAAVLEICREKHLPFREESLIIEDLLGAQEVFLTSSMMGIVPVTRIERHVVGDEKPGPITRQLMADYATCIESETPSDTD